MPPATGRIAALDVLRGLAVLGILVINIQAFGLPEIAYTMPLVAGGFDGANRWIWIAGHLLAEQKFISIFSLLFGAGVALFAASAARSGRAPLPLHYRRMLWLLLFGLVHAWLLWYGDILVLYALCGLLVVLARHWRTRTLLATAAALLLLTALLTGLFGSMLAQLQAALDDHDRQAAATRAGADPQAELLPGLSVAEARDRLARSRELWAPPPERIAAETAALTGSYAEELRQRIPAAIQVQGYTLAIWSWRTLALMLLGVVLLRSGFLAAERSTRCYAAVVLAGFGLGLPLVGVGLRQSIASGFDPIAQLAQLWLYNYFGSLLVAAGWIGLVLLACRSGAVTGLRMRLAAVGRMAFSNYILQTLVCTTIFYGRGGLGFAQFNQWDRGQLLLLVLAIWALQLWLSPQWLRRFRQGPLEWLWRRLTYGTRPRPAT